MAESGVAVSECAFVVASRPGFSLADVATALPEKLRPRRRRLSRFRKQPAKGDLVLPGHFAFAGDVHQKNLCH